MCPIPVPRIPIALEQDTPSKVTAEALQAELHNIGLTCRHTDIKNLKNYIEQVKGTFPDGKFQGYGVFSYQPPTLENFVPGVGTTMCFTDIVQAAATVNSNWTPGGTSPYMPQLSTVGYPAHFDYLKKNYQTFAGVKSEQTYQKNDSTVTAIKEQFVKIASNISSTLLENLDKDQLEAIFTNIIAPVDPSSTNYDSGKQNRNVYLVKGYSGGTCEAVGVLNVEYQLTISDYKKKKDTHQSYTLKVTVRASVYTDIQALLSEVLFLQTHFKATLFFDCAIPYPSEVKIYDEHPAANGDVFMHSLPMQQTENDRISAMVFFAPELENVGCIDNTDSQGSAVYSKAVTSGFSFTMTEKIAAGLKFSAGALFTKSEFSVNLEVSFTEQWNNSQTETVTFNVPGGAKAFLYQGYMNCAMLDYNIKTGTYSYRNQGAFLSNIIKTTPKPIDSAPAVILESGRADAALLEQTPLWETLQQIDC